MRLFPDRSGYPRIKRKSANTAPLNLGARSCHGLDSHKIWATAEGLVLETFPVERVGEFYEEATRGRSASHHLQVKAALALLSIARACPIERSTSFADPVVTLARAASDTPAGIQLSAAPVFIGAQIAGVVAGTLAFRWPTPD